MKRLNQEQLEAIGSKLSEVDLLLEAEAFSKYVPNKSRQILPDEIDGILHENSAQLNHLKLKFNNSQSDEYILERFLNVKRNQVIGLTCNMVGIITSTAESPQEQIEIVKECVFRIDEIKEAIPDIFNQIKPLVPENEDRNVFTGSLAEAKLILTEAGMCILPLIKLEILEKSIAVNE